MGVLGQGRDVLRTYTCDSLGHHHKTQGEKGKKSIEEVRWIAEQLGIGLLLMKGPDDPPAGVREPRRPPPSTGAGAAAVDPESEQ